MTFEIGQRIGGYEVVATIESPRYGVMYRVLNPVERRHEFLRLMALDARRDPEEVERFLREINVHSRLSHPNIVRFYQASTFDGYLVMTTEVTGGETLEQRLLRGPLPLGEGLGIAGQVLRALEYAHLEGVVHREVAGANIILGADGVVKLSGFGLAKGDTDPELTKAGTVMGWLEYIAPEQVQGMTHVDGRADLYATGVILYELAAGRVPFLCGSQFELMVAHVKTPPLPPRELRPDLPAELEDIILRALAKDPGDRFADARSFRLALEPVRAALLDEGRGPAPPTPAPVAPPPVSVAPTAAATPLPAPAQATTPAQPPAVAPGPNIGSLVLTGIVTFFAVLTLLFLVMNLFRG